MRQKSALGCGLVLAFAAMAVAQFPDRIYYKFNEGTGVGGTTLNEAAPGVGSVNAVVTGHTLNPVGGQFGGALNGAAPASTANFVNTGWTTSFPNTGWTISFWGDVSTIPTATLYYALGDSTAAGFRSFYNGAAGVGNCVLRATGMLDCIITAVGTGGGHTLTYVYDASIPALKGYRDGVLTTTVNQTLPNFTGTAPFRVAGYTSASWSGGAILDEFRVYSYALTDGQVAATAGITLFNTNILALSQSGPMVGDLTVSIGNLEPLAFEGWIILSSSVAAPAGTGPILGIYPDGTTFTTIAYPYFPGNPFHFHTNDAGVFPLVPFVADPGSVSGLAMMTFDFVAFFLRADSLYSSKSNVVRFTFM